MGTKRTVARDGSDSSHGGPRSRNAGQSGQHRFHARRADSVRPSIFSGHSRDQGVGGYSSFANHARASSRVVKTGNSRREKLRKLSENAGGNFSAPIHADFLT